MQKKMRVVQYGLGPIGQKATQYLVERPELEIVGAIDIDPQKVGKDLGELAGLPKLGVTITDDVESLLGKKDVDIVVLTTVSSLEKIKEQITGILQYGVNIVSTCEELSYPWGTKPEIAQEIDKLAQEKEVSVLGTGVNPGFLMDLLPLIMTGVCRHVKNITVERIQDAKFRRIPFQKKIGAGLTVAEFQGRVKAGSIRHVGLTESMHMVAAKMGWKYEKTEDLINPVIAQEEVKTDSMTIPAGDVLGVEQIGRCYVEGEPLITLKFRAAIGEPESKDRVIIEGAPDIDMVVKDGVNGDIATCAMIVNAIPAVIGGRPGLRTMADIEPVAFFK